MPATKLTLPVLHLIPIAILAMAIAISAAWILNSQGAEAATDHLTTNEVTQVTPDSLLPSSPTADWCDNNDPLAASTGPFLTGPDNTPAHPCLRVCYCHWISIPPGIVIRLCDCVCLHPPHIF